MLDIFAIPLSLRLILFATRRRILLSHIITLLTRHRRTHAVIIAITHIIIALHSLTVAVVFMSIESFPSVITLLTV